MAKWYVVNVQTIAIDSVFDRMADATARLMELKDSGTPAKVMTQPAVGGQRLPPNDEASWIPKRRNPRRNPGGPGGDSSVRSPTSTRSEVRSPTSTSTEVRSPTSTSTEVRSPTSTSTDAYTAGNITVTGGAGAGATTSVEVYPRAGGRTRVEQSEHRAWRQSRDGVRRATPSDQPEGQNAPSFRERLGQRMPGMATPDAAPFRERLGQHHPGMDYDLDEDAAVGTDYDVGEHEQNPDWRAIGAKAKRGARSAVHHTKRAVAATRQVAGELAEGWAQENPVCTCDPRFNSEDCEIHGGLRENPGELLVVNGAEMDSARAEEIYEMWHKKNPHGVGTFRPGCDGDDEMVCVGRAFDIVYRSGKWEKGRKTNDYVHTFDSKPKVWMLRHLVEDGMKTSGSKTVESLLKKSKNADGQFAVADLATPLSFNLDDGDEGCEVAIHNGSKVYGAIDQKTVLICDPHWKLIIISGGQMHFDERGIVK